MCVWYVVCVCVHTYMHTCIYAKDVYLYGVYVGLCMLAYVCLCVVCVHVLCVCLYL